MKAYLAILLAIILSPFRELAAAYAEREQFGVRSFRGPRDPSGVRRAIFADTGYTDRDQFSHAFQGLFSQLDPTMWFVIKEDFERYLAADWVLTETQAGATQALTAGAGGLMLFTNSAADDDLVQLQWAGSAGAVMPNFKFTLAKPLVFGCRLAVSDATQSDVMAGLWLADTSPVASAPSDGVWFYKADGAATFAVQASKTSAIVQATAVGSMVDATMCSLEFAWDGVSKIYYGKDGVLLGSFSPGVSLPDTVNVALSVALQNGEAVAKTLTVDYLFAAQYRG